MTMAPTPPPLFWNAVGAIRYAYPGVVFCYFVLALMITVCTLQTQRLRVQDQHVRRDVILGMVFGVTLSYLAELIVLVVQALATTYEEPLDDRLVYLIASTISFGAQCLALTDSKFPVWYPYYGTWFLGLFVELILLVVPHVFAPPHSPFDFTTIVLQSIRVCFFAILPVLYFRLRNDEKEYDNADAERQALLGKSLAGKQSSEDSSKSYGGTKDTKTQKSDSTDTANSTASEDSWITRQREKEERVQKRLQQDGDWFTYAKGFAVFLPYLWPVHDKKLQFRAVLVGFCLLASNALNVLVPTQMGYMLDSLSKYLSAEEGDPKPNVWLPVALYAALRFCSGGAGIGWLKKWLWLPVEQYSYNALGTASHAHLMSLSSDFHDTKTSSDLTQAITGGRSVSDLLETVCFQLLPMFIDLAVAFAFLWALYGPYMGLLMAATAITYLYVTTKLYSLRAAKRRDYITIYRREWTIGTQSLDGWGTASLFNMIPYEQHRYSCAVEDHMKAKKSYEMSSQAIGAAQGLILTIGLLGALWLGVFQVVYQNKSIGQFSTLLVYWAQLQSPLAFFASMYRQISYGLMDAERLLELLQTKPTITDSPTAKPLKLGKGLVKFDRVSFAYDERKPTLKSVSFEVPPGKTVALVGETGGGKSTILKLIDRFYDVKSGSISIDGQDIRDVTLSSLRGKIGVVPQDPMLFNDSIMNNIRYARLTATDQEVYEACKAAAVHEKIMSFPDGYNSKVGDRGVKLSGGEKQRVAIARAILKQPEIILLDEATSAVDTETEQMIQEGFRTLCKDRTTFIVAHRLSTIMNADHILVVINGEIVEMGTHDELIHSGGKYHDLWSKQIFVKPSPANERSRSSSPKKRNANIVNDLTPQRHTQELAKVLKATPHEDSSGQNITGNEDAGKVEINGHKREGSKLKPDAPEFIPGRGSATPTSVSKTNAKEAAKEAVKVQKKQEKEEKKAAILAKKAEKAEKKIGKLDPNLVASTEGESSSGPSSEQLTGGEISTKEKAKPKRYRYTRQLSRSDPSNRIDQIDGQQDSDVTAFSSGEGQAYHNPAMQRRRVSAPNHPPAASDTRGPRRRSRHWRLRNRAAEIGNASLSASGEASTDEIHGPVPPAPSPAVGALPKNNTTPRVKFAPSHVEGTGSAF